VLGTTGRALGSLRDREGAVLDLEEMQQGAGSFSWTVTSLLPF